MMKSVSILTLLLLASLATTQAQTPEKWKARQYTAYQGTELPYRLYSPESIDESASYPLVIFLHGAGERGNDNESQLKHVAKSFEAIQSDYPSFILFPQVAQERWWSSGEYNRESAVVQMEYQAGDYLSAVMSVIDQLMQEYPIDPDRVYIGGLSMGGFGTWDAIARWPEKFAAAFPICGAGDPSQAGRMTGLPIWVLHGGDDTVVPVDASRMMVEAIREAGGSVIYTEFEGVGHNSWDPAFESRHLLDWIYAQNRH